MTTHPTPKDWRKEFVETFHIYNLKTGTPAGAEKEAVAFIETLLSHAQEEERARIVGRLEAEKQEVGSINSNYFEPRIIRNKTLDQAIDIVKDNK
jgi:exoribonuclease II